MALAVKANAPDLFEHHLVYPVRITIRPYQRRGKLDASNAGYLAKLIEDGLKNCGLPDDSGEWVESITLYPGRIDPDNPRVDVEIADLSDLDRESRQLYTGR